MSAEIRTRNALSRAGSVSGSEASIPRMSKPTTVSRSAASDAARDRCGAQNPMSFPKKKISARGGRVLSVVV